MTGHKTRLPKGTQVKDGKVVTPVRQPKDVSTRLRQKKSKRQMAVSKARAALLNSIGKGLK